MKKLLCLFCFIFFVTVTFSQSSIVSQKGDLVKIMISPQSANFKNKIGEKVNFNVALYKFGKLLNDVTIYYEAGPETMKPQNTGYLNLKGGQGIIKADMMNQAGFLRCYVSYEENGYKYENTATAGINPEKIKPTVRIPADFKKFWSANLKSLSEVPINPKLTLMPEKCTHKVDVYKVCLDNIAVVGSHKTHVYGILCIPKSEKKLPAILNVPGAGVRSYNGLVKWAEKGYITFQIGIHGIPVDLYDSQIYDDLNKGALWRYSFYNIDSKDNYYMKRVFLSCIRAIDFIYSLKEFDGENMGVIGGSQGGALSIVTGSLDNRIKALVSYYPAMCDMEGYLHNRAGGWPHMFNVGFITSDEKIKVAAYYDVVNFAKNLTIPGFYAFGYNDNVCPPTSVCAAINCISAPKTVHIYYDTSHWSYKEESDAGFRWLCKQLKK